MEIKHEKEYFPNPNVRRCTFSLHSTSIHKKTVIFVHSEDSFYIKLVFVKNIIRLNLYMPQEMQIFIITMDTRYQASQTYKMR